MDKVSVLGDAAKYLKQLQERVKMLEEQTAMKTMESGASVKKSDELCDNDQIYSDSCCSQTHLEMEATVSNKDVLIRIHCERQKGFTGKILHEIEKLHLTIVNNSCFSFDNYVMVVTVVAQVIPFPLSFIYFPKLVRQFKILRFFCFFYSENHADPSNHVIKDNT